MNLKQIIAKNLAACGALYDRPVDRDMVELFAAALEAHAPEQVDFGFRAHLGDPQRGQYFPKPADIVAQIVATQPSPRELAERAWSQVPALLRNSRQARSDDPITQQVVAELGGWVSLGMKTAAELTWVHKEFVDRYQTHTRLSAPQLAAPDPRKVIGSDA